MNEQPDKLFRDKLHGYQKPVRPEVWKRISETRSHASRQVVWLRAAATILIVAAAGILIFPVMQHDRPPLAGKEGETAPAPHAASPTESLASESQAVQEKETAQHEEPPTTARQSALAKKNRSKRSSTMLKPATTSAEPEQIVVSSAPAQEPEGLTSGRVVAANPSLESPAISQRKTVTIVFTREEVNQKYLSRRNEAHATSEGKPPSTLRNLLDKAQDLKHNQDPLGEIRQKKDEILAMNFRKDKQRTENN